MKLFSLTLCCLAATATVSATSLKFRHPSTANEVAIEFTSKGTLVIPQHTDKIATLEAWKTQTDLDLVRIENKVNTVSDDLAQLRLEFTNYVRDQNSEDHNTIDISALQTQVDKLDGDFYKTPVNGHAFTCKHGDVDEDARKCTCETNRWGGGKYVSGTAYPKCNECSNIDCSPNFYQSGACSTDDNNNFTCESCDNKTCGPNKYQKGKCNSDAASKRINGFTCHDCDHQTCDAGQYQDGTCSGRTNGFTCKPCDNLTCGDNEYQHGDCTGRINGFGCKTCDNQTCGHNQYRVGECTGRSNGFECKTCDRIECPAGYYRTGSCSGTNNGYQCTPCSHKDGCPSGQVRMGQCSGTNNGYYCQNYADTCEWRNTPSNDDGGGNTVYFDRHHTQCDGAHEYMKGWKLRRDGHNKIYFQSQCCGGAAPGTCSWIQTSSNDDGGGNHVYFDRHHLACGNDQYMKSWQLRRDGHHKIYFKGQCCAANGGSKQCETQQTSCQDDGGGNTVYFDRHAPVCSGSKQRMKSWKLVRCHGNRQIRFEYTCCDA